MTSSQGFQTQVTVQPAPAVEGDFASANPRFSVDAGQGALVAGLLGVLIGRFGWLDYSRLDNDNAPAIVNSYGVGAVAGLVGRNQQGLITAYLTEAGMTIQPGTQMWLYNGGDFWVKNRGTTTALIGQKAFANNADGSVLFAAAGATPSTASVVGTIAAAVTPNFTASIAGNVLTVTGTSGGGPLVNGATLSGTGGGGVASGTKIVSQLSGTTGGVGTYALNIGNQTVTSTAMTAAYGVLTVSSVNSGVIGVGDVLVSGTALTAATAISQLGTGTGLTGTYYVDPSQNSTPGLTITAALAVETKWIAMSSGLAGELVKISDHPLG